MPTWLAIVTVVGPLLLNLMQIIEKTSESVPEEEKPTGEEKKTAAIDGLKTLISFFALSSTGGQKKTWENIATAFPGLEALFGKTIDLLAKVIS